jgi:hypothetical protein
VTRGDSSVDHVGGETLRQCHPPGDHTVLTLSKSRDRMDGIHGAMEPSGADIAPLA